MVNYDEVFGNLVDEQAPVKPLGLVDRLAKDNKTFKILSGFSRLDEIIGGFRSGGCYLVGGLEKSGKSSFLMSIANNLLASGRKIGFINTELTDEDFAARMAALWTDKTIAETESRPEEIKDWAIKHERLLFYAGIDDLVENGELAFKKTLKLMDRFVDGGAKILFLDNLTSYNSQAIGGRQGWENLAACISRVVNFAKQSNVIVFVVIHTKPDTVFSDTPAGVRSILEDDHPERILKESLTVVRRPSLSDVYGSGGALSQLTGSLLVWRPFQKFDDPDLKKLGLILCDSFRHAPSGENITVNFLGERGKFEEVYSAYEEAKKIFNNNNEFTR